MSRMPEPRTVSLLDRPPLKARVGGTDILAGLPPARRQESTTPTPPKPPVAAKPAPEPKAAAPKPVKPKARPRIKNVEALAAIAAHQFVIEDNVALPPGRRVGSLAERLPMEALQVGQSFLIPHAATSTVGTWVTRWEKRLEGRKFVRAREDGGMRVWRIA